MRTWVQKETDSAALREKPNLLNKLFIYTGLVTGIQIMKSVSWTFIETEYIHSLKMTI